MYLRTQSFCLGKHKAKMSIAKTKRWRKICYLKQVWRVTYKTMPSTNEGNSDFVWESIRGGYIPENAWCKSIIEEGKILGTFFEHMLEKVEWWIDASGCTQLAS